MKLKDILIEARLYSLNIKEVLEKFLSFENRTMVLFDTETTGLEANTSYIQLTHIAAMAFDGSTFKEIGEYSKKINLGDQTKRAIDDPESAEYKQLAKDRERHFRKYKKQDLHPSDALKMTGYEGGNAERVDEKQGLIEFEQFINSHPNVVLIAHNATFDMKTIQARRRFHKLPPMKRVPVLDTVKISRFFFIPALLSVQGNIEAERILAGLLAKTKYKSYSSSLGNLAKVFEIKIDGWHDAKEDVKMLMGVLQKMIIFLKQNADVDIKDQQAAAAKRFRNMK